MDGFKRPTRPSSPDARPPVQVQPRPQAPVQPPAPETHLPHQSLNIEQNPEPTLPPIEPIAEPNTPKRRSRSKKLLIAIIAVVILVGALIAAGFMWYDNAIQPADPSDKNTIKIEVKEETSLNAVATNLEQKKVIKSAPAFMLYARIHNLENVKAGTCNFTRSESVPAILEKLNIGCHDFKVVTFYPGATIDTSLYAKNLAAEKNQDFVDFSVRQSLRTAGYSASDIDAALTATYSGPLFADKPANTSYEGYIFGETYYVDEDATAKEVLQTAFDHMYTIVQKNSLTEKFKAQGLTLYQGITLASIVEKELDCEGKPTEERKQRCYGFQQRIASVFYNRMREGMTLGSDVTFIYAADRLGVSPSVDVDSLYNLRVHTGLTPGPIASPGELSLLAVANPASSNDLFFLAGDDGLIYFATDNAGHERNIRDHCQEGCGGAV